MSLELTQMFKTGFVYCVVKYFKSIYQKCLHQQKFQGKWFFFLKKKRNTTIFLFTVGLFAF